MTSFVDKARLLTETCGRLLLKGKPEEVPLGFGLTPVKSGANVIINAQPQVSLVVKRLIIPDSINSKFVLNDFKIGLRSQFHGPGSIPAAAFSEQALGADISGDIAFVGNFVTLDVTNISKEDVNFTAAMYGTTDFAVLLKTLLGRFS